MQGTFFAAAENSRPRERQLYIVGLLQHAHLTSNLFSPQTHLGTGTKVERALRVKQIRDARRAEILQERRKSRLAPKVVAFLGLSDDLNIGDFIESFVKAAGYPEPSEIIEAMAAKPNIPVTMFIERHRVCLSLLTVRPSIPLAALEVAKVADLLLVVAPIEDRGNTKAPGRSSSHSGDKFWTPCRADKLSCETEVSAQVESALTLLRAQGLPTTICAIRGLSKFPYGKRSAMRTAATNAVSRLLKYPTNTMKALPADSPEELFELVRQVANLACTQPMWRSARAYVLAERISVLPVSELRDCPRAPTVTLSIEGYIRATCMTADQLVHLPGVGDFSVENILEIPERSNNDFKHPVHRRESASVDESITSEDIRIHVPNPDLCDIPLRVNFSNTPVGEQTWPTANDFIKGHADVDTGRQELHTAGNAISWIDEADSCNIPLEPGQVEDIELPGMGMDRTEYQPQVHCESYLAGRGEDDHRRIMRLGGDANYSGARDEMQIDLDSARRDSVKHDVQADEQVESMSPDEVETPVHITARDRFARYRGLKSFRSSRWDPKEELPLEYAKLFAFKDFRRATHRAKSRAADQERHSVCVGTFVQINIKGVPRAAANALLVDEVVGKPFSCEGLVEGVVGSGVGPVWNGWSGGAGPVILSTLLQHESRLTVMHYGVTKSASYDMPWRSKTPLWFHIGFRRERAAPIFSSDGLGDKHKYEPFLPLKKLVVASVYGPVVFPPAPVLGLEEELVSGKFAARLVLSGNVRKSDPDRIILKRIVLTGVPFKTHKSKAVIRQMFFCPEDVRWFKPLELWTKYGMRGKIKEAIGTHGHMKCVFNGVIQQQDTVFATLYKRVFPKFLKS